MLNNILSSIDPTVKPKSPAPGAGVRQTPPAGVPKSAPRTTGPINGASQTQPLKRKADGQPDTGHVKIQRKEGVPQAARPNGSVRPAPTPDVAKPKPSVPANPIPYRGTAGMGTVKPAGTTVKKPSPSVSTPSAVSKPANPVPKTVGTAPTPGAAPIKAKVGSYAAMLAKAKEVQQTKPAPPPIKHEPTKILTKAERLALRAEASGKGKKSGLVSNGQARSSDPKIDIKEKRKPTELGYQGTARPQAAVPARPAKKPVEVGYKGTARPQTTTAGPAGRTSGFTSAKAKAKQPQSRYDGYAEWSDIDDEEDEEDDYNSESDMEGGMWDVEQEEQLALKAARKEDAEALAEENELKRQKEERKRKLAAMNKAAAAKRKF